MRAGRAVCWRCGEAIAPGDDWDLGHDDAGAVAGPEHRSSCNRRAAGLKAAGKAWSAPQRQDLTDMQTRADRAAERRRERQRHREQEQ